MAKIKSKDTKPELVVRSLLHSMGYRFRLHRKDLPGKPDIVLPKYKTVIFVHGCFWHQHDGCSKSVSPKSNEDYWLPKLANTKARDMENAEKLRLLGWKVVIIWECQINNKEELLSRLDKIDE